MAATYVERLGGYIADVPQFYFKRGDGEVFVNRHVTQCSLNPQIDFQEVRAGWSNYASAYLPGQATMDINITMGDFDANLFAIANATKFENDQTFQVPVIEVLTPDRSGKITFSKTPIAGTISITGFTPDSQITVDEGNTYTIPVDVIFENSPANTVLRSFEVSYMTTDEGAMVTNIDNKSVACGETVLKWPVYSDNKNCTESGVIKYVIVRIFKTRVTTAPGWLESKPNKVLHAAMHVDPFLNGERLAA